MTTADTPAAAPSGAAPSLDRASMRQRLEELCVKRGHFILASGREASLYLDVRNASLHADTVGALGAALFVALARFAPQAVGGPVAGAVPLVAAVLVEAGRRGQSLPGFMVRQEAKNHGAGQQIDGHLQPGWQVALVEDVVTSGGSVLRAIAAVRAAGAEVVAVAAVVDREEGGRDALAAAGVPLVALFTLREIAGDAV